MRIGDDMARRRDTTAGARPGHAGARAASSRGGKRATNLTLDPDAVARGERFGARHGKSLSQLVNDFLDALPLDDVPAPPALAPAVRRLWGVAAGGAADHDAHRAHLLAKYGSGRP